MRTFNTSLFRKLRNQKEVSIAAMAADTGLSESMINQAELGTRTPSAVSLGIIADYFDVSTEMFYEQETKSI